MTNDGPQAWVASGSSPASGDAPRFRAELAKAAPAVRRFLFGLCGDWHRSEDLSQEALLSAWRKRESFNGQAGLRTWVFAIARNHWLTGLRQQARRPREEPVNESCQISLAAAPDAAAARGRPVGLADQPAQVVQQADAPPVVPSDYAKARRTRRRRPARFICRSSRERVRHSPSVVELRSWTSSLRLSFFGSSDDILVLHPYAPSSFGRSIAHSPSTTLSVSRMMP